MIQDSSINATLESDGQKVKSETSGISECCKNRCCSDSVDDDISSFGEQSEIILG